MLLSWGHQWQGGGPWQSVGLVSPRMRIVKGCFSILLSPHRGLSDLNHSDKAALREGSEKNTDAASSNFCY